ncbi:MAG: OmpH family outer membrane protein [Gammaproteobacteria bacterium]|nr:OmpH family outer membrane protein [Gammaproteobacteria bacterium]MCY4166280.1 OmpH family outer membrane protein [Gammaproteobacteria bacterium]MCY4256622.1 OmpH family outer membrane protein [Gammaproteobacteria bacterium]MCY4341018.1 OmpH family outer membrane protein [Gammaproteobacteria bacterium]
MKIAKTLLAGAAAGLFAAGGLLAQESALKIGFVNLEALTVESPQGREANERISEMFAPRQRELNASQTRLEELTENYERDSETMGTEQLRTAEREIIALRREIQQMNQALQEDFQLEQETSRRDLGSTFLSHVRQVAEANEYDLVLTGGVVYFSDAVNITPQVLGALQETYSSNQQD